MLHRGLLLSGGHGRGGRLHPLRGDRLLFERLRVPLFELADQLLLLIIDGLLSELSLFLELLELFIGISVLLFELFELAELLQFLLVDDFCLIVTIQVFEAVRLGCEARVH